MSIPENLVIPIWNQENITGGSKYIYVPNDFSDYDEVWAHIMIHGTEGEPTSGNLQIKWQISHPQAGGSYHDVNPIWQDLDYKQNGHLFHSGLDFPFKIVRTVEETFEPAVEFIRGIRLATGRVRLKIIPTFAGGTNPSYVISLSLYARRATPDMKPIPQPKLLTQNNTLYDYIRDVWGVSIRNKDDGVAKVLFKNGGNSNDLRWAEQLSANGSITRILDRPIRFEDGLYLEEALGGSNGLDIIVFTTDNITN